MIWNFWAYIFKAPNPRDFRVTYFYVRKVTITQFKFLLTFRFLWKTVDNKFEASLFATVGSNCRPLICKRMASVLITVTWQVFVWDFSNQNVSHYVFSKNQFNMKSISLVQMSMIFLLGDDTLTDLSNGSIFHQDAILYGKIWMYCWDFFEAR